MGQSAHPGRPAMRAPAALALTALAAAGVLTGCGSSIASAPTVLQGVAVATVVHPDGSAVAGYDGLKLAPGDVVRTGDGGRAELVTRDRIVYVGSKAAVEVVNGARQQLRTGSVVVNAVHGPGLDLQVADLDVSAPSGSGVRAERSVLVRIGALAGHADITSSTGRRLTVPALHQAMVGGDALPDSSTPLQLTDDDGEARTVPDLVRDDETLNGIARGLDTVGASMVSTISVTWHRGFAATPKGTGRSERLLPAVIAAAGPATGVLDRYHAAVADRQGGGSWGVVAHLVDVGASNVVSALAAFERGQPNGHLGSVATVLASVTGTGTGTGADGGEHDSGGTHTHGNGGGPTGGGGNGGGGSGKPTPSPSPGGPLTGVQKTIDKTVAKVIGLLPTPPPTHLPLPVPLPTVKLPVLPTSLP